MLIRSKVSEQEKQALIYQLTIRSAAKRKHLIKALGISGRKLNIIKEAVNDDPTLDGIGSDRTRGYFLVRDDIDFREAFKVYDGLEASCRAQKQKLSKKYYAKFKTQLDLPLEEASHV